MFHGVTRPLAVTCGGVFCSLSLCFLFSVPSFLFAAFFFLFTIFLRFLIFKKTLSKAILKSVFCFSLGCIVGFLWKGGYDIAIVKPSSCLAGERRTVSLLVTENQMYSLTGYAPIDGHYRKLYLKHNPNSKYKSGDCLSLEVALSKPQFAGGFDGERMYMSDGIFLIASPVDKKAVICKKEACPFFTALGKLRTACSGKIQSLYGKDSGAMAALLLGQKDGLSSTKKDALSAVGLSHAFVVSGMHLSFLSQAIQLFSSFHPLLGILVPIIAFSYAALTGFGLSVLRAFLMLLYYRISRRTRRRPDATTSLFLSLILLLFPNPYALLNPGLILSYLAIGGILYIKPWIGKSVSMLFLFFSSREWIISRLKSLFNALLTSLSAGLATLPATACFMGKISLVFLPANLLLLFFITFCFYGGMLSLLISFLFPPLGSLSAFPIKWVLSVFEDAIQTMQALPLSSYGIEAFPILIYLSLALALLFYLAIRNKKLLHPLPVGLLVCGFLISLLVGKITFARTDFSLLCLPSSSPCLFLTVGDQNLLLGYDESILPLLEKKNLDNIDYSVAFSDKAQALSPPLCRNVLDAPCLLKLGKISLTYTSQSNIILSYPSGRIYIWCNAEALPTEEGLILVTPNLLNSEAMITLLGKRQVILLGKPPRKLPSDLTISQTPYYSGALYLSGGDSVKIR